MRTYAIALVATVMMVACTHIARAYDCSEATYQAARGRMTLAFGTGVLKNDKGTSVFISERYWRGLSFAEKQAFADQLVCAVAGVGKGLASMTFRSDMTGNPVGEWSWGTLTVPR